MRNSASNFVPTCDLSFGRFPQDVYLQDFLCDCYGCLASPVERRVAHGVSANLFCKSCACQEGNVFLQRGKAEDEESLVKNRFFLLCSIERILIIQVAGKTYPSADVV